MPTEHDTKAYSRRAQAAEKATIVAEHNEVHTVLHGRSDAITEAVRDARVPSRYDNTALAYVVSRHSAAAVIDELEKAGHTVTHLGH